MRRRRCAPVVTWVEEGEARLMKSQREEKLASSLGQGLRKLPEDCVYDNLGGRLAERVGAKA